MAHPVGIQQTDDDGLKLLHGKLLPLGSGIIQAVFMDVLPHLFRQEFPFAAEGQQPAELGGGDLRHPVLQQGHGNALRAELLLHPGDFLPFPFAAPAEYRQMGHCNRKIKKTHRPLKKCGFYGKLT